MSNRILTKEQIMELLNNSNIVKCSEKSITFSKEFKINAVKRYYEEEIPSSRIFIDAGFNLSVIGKKTPKRRLSDWKEIYKIKGENGLLIETRGKGRGGGRPKTKGITPEDRIKRLEAENAYLKAENDFLAKLRAKRRTE
jgi:transposase-like protein